MPENSVACVATMACCVMGATYQDVVRHCGHIGVPFMFGEPGSCKTEAIRCALALFGAHESHFYNSQTTALFLFDVLKRTTIRVAIDDISEKAQETWEELIVDAYNNTARGTRAYSVENFSTLPMVSANWRFPGGRGRAFTRCITIPFLQHGDEPNATQLFSELVDIRSRASASVGVVVKCCSEFSSTTSQDQLHSDLFATISTIYQSAHARLKSTMTIFMHFFLKVAINGFSLFCMKFDYSLLHILIGCSMLWCGIRNMLGFCVQPHGSTLFRQLSTLYQSTNICNRH